MYLVLEKRSSIRKLQSTCLVKAAILCFLLGLANGLYVGIDSRSAYMYCFLCQDFIYDPFVEKTRVTKQAELMEGTGECIIIRPLYNIRSPVY